IFCHYGISPHRLVHRKRKRPPSTVLRIQGGIGSVIYGVLHIRFTIGQGKGKWCTGAGGRRRKSLSSRHNTNANALIKRYRTSSVACGPNRVNSRNSDTRKSQIATGTGNGQSCWCSSPEKLIADISFTALNGNGVGSSLATRPSQNHRQSLV